MNSLPPYDPVLLARKWLDGTITPEEKKWFDNWYHQFNFSELELDEHWASDKEELRSVLLGRLLHEIREVVPDADPALERRRIIPLWIKRGAIAAAVCGLLLAGWQLWKVNNTDPARQAIVQHNARHDVAPGGDKAVLTLSDGSNIVLDQAADGTLSVQGNARVVKQEGKLLYHADRNNQQVNSAIAYNTLTTPKGGQYQLVLPDGSKVWLNAASALHYPIAFADTLREVVVSGEAYFEIAKDNKRPFRVRFTSNNEQAAVEVLGTHFNIAAYTNEPFATTSLLEGKVRVVKNGLRRVLEVGQQAVMKSKNNSIVVSEADVAAAAAWKEGYFVFDGAGIETIMRQVARWYNLEVVYEGSSNIAHEFTGKISRKAKLSELFGVLEYAGVHFRIERAPAGQLPGKVVAIL